MKLTMYNMELWFEPKEARPGYVLLRARTLKDMHNYMLIVTAHEADQISDAIFNAAEDAKRHGNWQTSASRDYRTPNSPESQEARKHSGGEQLPNFVEHSFSLPALQTLSGAISSVPVVSIRGSALSPTKRPEHVLGRRRLNPAFACWLMGWPWWWRIQESPTAPSRQWSRTASSCDSNYRTSLQSIWKERMNHDCENNRSGIEAFLC